MRYSGCTCCVNLCINILSFSYPTLEVGRCLPSGQGENRASTHCNNIVVLHSGNHDGVISMDSQVETVLGPQPQRGPLPATGVSGSSRQSSWGLQKICSWHPSMWRSRERGFVNATITSNAEEEFPCPVDFCFERQMTNVSNFWQVELHILFDQINIMNIYTPIFTEMELRFIIESGLIPAAMSQSSISLCTWFYVCL